MVISLPRIWHRPWQLKLPLFWVNCDVTLRYVRWDLKAGSTLWNSAVSVFQPIYRPVFSTFFAYFLGRVSAVDHFRFTDQNQDFGHEELFQLIWLCIGSGDSIACDFSFDSAAHSITEPTWDRIPFTSAFNFFSISYCLDIWETEQFVWFFLAQRICRVEWKISRKSVQFLEVISSYRSEVQAALPRSPWIQSSEEQIVRIRVIKCDFLFTMVFDILNLPSWQLKWVLVHG
jgi:hypothetical protein